MSGRGTNKIGLRSAGDHLRFREFLRDGQVITLADSSARLPLSAVGFRVKLPDQYIHTILEFTWHEQRGRCDLYVQVGPVWVSSHKNPRRKKKLDHDATYDMVLGDLVHLTDRTDDLLTIELYRDTKAAQVDSHSVPSAGRKQPEELKPGDLLPVEPGAKVAPLIVEDDPDIDPKGWKRKWDKRWRDFRTTYLVPWRKRWAEVKYWQSTGKRLWAAAMGIVTMAAGVLGLVALWDYVDRQRTPDPVTDPNSKVTLDGYVPPRAETLLLANALQRLAPEGKFERLSPLPGEPFALWTRWPGGAGQPPASSLTSLAGEVKPILDRVHRTAADEFQALVSPWCSVSPAPLKQARIDATGLDKPPVKWLIAYGPAVRTQYCPMYFDDEGRVGWSGTRSDTQTRAQRKQLSTDLVPSHERGSKQFWQACGYHDNSNLLLQWAAALQGLPPSKTYVFSEVEATLSKVRTEEAQEVEAALASAVKKHQGTALIGPKQHLLDLYFFGLWRHDQGDLAIDELVEAMLEDPDVAPHCSDVGCLRYLQVRRWAIDRRDWTPDRSDFPLEVLSWYVVFEQLLKTNGVPCGPPAD